MPRSDILLNDDYSLKCVNGDFATGDSDAQNVDLLLTSTKGSFKESPAVGVGLINFLKKNVSSLREIRREIMVQLQNDGYKASNFEVDENGEFTIDYEPSYE
jgi:hypothetical protein